MQVILLRAGGADEIDKIAFISHQEVPLNIKCAPLQFLTYQTLTTMSLFSNFTILDLTHIKSN